MTTKSFQCYKRYDIYINMIYGLTDKKQKKTKTCYQIITRLVIQVFFISIFTQFITLPAYAFGNSSQFPLYPITRDNVFFWEKIYSTHSINTAVLHDKNDLGVVYATISLKNNSYRNAERLNKKKIESAKRKYQTILENLAKGKSARFGQTKKVKNIFPANTTKRTFALAADNIRVQTGLKERFAEGVIRSGAYMREIKQIFKSYNLPQDLAYLPHVESSFNLKAHSKLGASGIWQFTRTTGKQYLQIDDAIDERRDPIIAAHAAAKFLKNNYKDLQNWPMAITAYNYGKAGMMRAKADKGTYERIFASYSQGHFKFASKNFYSEFLAAVYVAKKLEQSKTLKLHRPKSTYSVRLPAYTSAKKFCRYLQISTEELKTLNPALLSTVFTGEKYIPKDHYLRLPAARVNKSALSNMPSSLFSSNQKQSLTYKVRKGDSALRIAIKHKVTLKELAKKNNLNKQSQVYIGQTLKIPQSKQTTQSKGIKTIRAISKKRYINSKLSSNSSSSAHTPMQNPVKLKVGNLHSKKGIFYGDIVAQPGESLSLIAKWLNISESTLRSINRLSSQQTVLPGQIITLSFNKTSRPEFEKKRAFFH